MPRRADTNAPGLKTFKASLNEMVKFAQNKEAEVKVETLVINPKETVKLAKNTMCSITGPQGPTFRKEARRQSKAVATNAHAKEDQAFIDSISRSVEPWTTKRLHQTKPPAAAGTGRTRIVVRVPDHMRETLEQAATLMGLTVNQFIVQSSYQKAQRLLERESVIKLSRKDWLKIRDLVARPPKPNKKMREAMKFARRAVRA